MGLKTWGSHISAALDLDTPSSNGEGNEGDEGDEGHEGNEEEEREQDCHRQDGQGHGAPWLQGKDRRWLDGEGLDQELQKPSRRARPSTPRQRSSSRLECTWSRSATNDLCLSLREAPAPAVGISTAVERRSPQLQAETVTKDVI